MPQRMRPPFVSTALQHTTLLVHCMLTEWLQMPADLEPYVLAAIMESRYTRPTQLKQHLAVIQTGRTDLDHFFDRIMTPQFTLDVLEDVHREGLLTRQQATQAEHYALAVVDKTGQWKEETR